MDGNGIRAEEIVKIVEYESKIAGGENRGWGGFVK